MPTKASSPPSRSKWRTFFDGVFIIFVFLIAALSLPDTVLKRTTFTTPVFDEIIPPGTGAKRVVMIVADGLSADVALKGFFNQDDSLMNNLKSRVFERKDSLCMVATSDPPALSQPAHIAMLGGVPESAENLKNGWRMFSKDIDHILKRASNSWSIGEEDVVSLFQGDKVQAISIPPRSERPDGSEDMTLTRYKELLQSAKTDSNLKSRLLEEKNLFFLHFTPIVQDSYRAYSTPEVWSSIAKHFDSVIPQIERLTKEFFNDNETTFLFTSSHGFPENGFFGGEDSVNRRCPFVIWNNSFLFNDQSPKSADVSIGTLQIPSILSAILGIPTPSNNIAFYPKDTIPLPESIAAVTLLAQYGQHVGELCTRAANYRKRSWVVGELGMHACVKYRMEFRFARMDMSQYTLNDALEQDEMLLEYFYLFCGYHCGVILLLVLFVFGNFSITDKVESIIVGKRYLIAIGYPVVTALAWFKFGFRTPLSAISEGLIHFIIYANVSSEVPPQYFKHWEHRLVFFATLMVVMFTCRDLSTEILHMAVSVAVALIMAHMAFIFYERGVSKSACFSLLLVSPLAYIILYWGDFLTKKFAYWPAIYCTVAALPSLYAIFSSAASVDLYLAIPQAAYFVAILFKDIGSKIRLYLVWIVYFMAVCAAITTSTVPDKKSKYLTKPAPGTVGTFFMAVDAWTKILMSIIPLDCYVVFDYTAGSDHAFLIKKLGFIIISCLIGAIYYIQALRNNQKNHASPLYYLSWMVSIVLLAVIFSFRTDRKQEIILLWFSKLMILPVIALVSLIAGIVYASSGYIRKAKLKLN